MATLTFDNAGGDGWLNNEENWAPLHNTIPNVNTDVVFAADATYHASEDPMTMTWKTIDMRGYEVWLRSDNALKGANAGTITVNATSSLNLFGSIAEVIGIRSTSGDVTFVFSATQPSCIVTSSNLTIDSWTQVIATATVQPLFAKVTTSPTITITGSIYTKNANRVANGVNLIVGGSLSCAKNETLSWFEGGSLNCYGNVVCGIMANVFSNCTLVQIADSLTLNTCGSIFSDCTNVTVGDSISTGNISYLNNGTSAIEVGGSITTGTCTTFMSSGTLTVVGDITIGNYTLFAITAVVTCNDLTVGNSTGNNFAVGGTVNTVITANNITTGTIPQFFVTTGFIGENSINFSGTLDIERIGFTLIGLGSWVINGPLIYSGTSKVALGPYPITQTSIGPLPRYATAVDGEIHSYCGCMEFSSNVLPLATSGTLGTKLVTAVKIGNFPIT